MAIPEGGWVGIALLIALWTVSIVAQPIRIFLNALVCKIFNVPRDRIAEFALSEARKRPPSAVREIAAVFAALVRRPNQRQAALIAPPSSGGVSRENTNGPSATTTGEVAEGDV